MMRIIQYVNVLRPTIDYLDKCDKLLLDSRDMAEFLRVPVKIIHQLVYGDRIPLPMRLGIGKCFRWNIFELLDWVQAGCPRRTEWIRIRGTSGWYPEWRWGRWWLP